ncbi:DUF4850 domain-containing protein [Pasteurella sp. PK-2025]|uniref:DUF4850 domain-containing protein n=1 Tax=Pasteurella sp. PK-2025 TaxID=3413133 RepID=UPI003C72F45F
MRITLSLFTILFCLGYSSLSVAEQYSFSFAPRLPNASRMMKAHFVKKITLNQQEISLYQTEYEDNVDGGWLKSPINPLSTKLNAATLAQFDVYAMPYGQMLLVPQNWQLVDGGVGANGSTSYVFAPKKGKGYFKYYHAASCMGCAMMSASALFPEARKDAQDNDFLFYEGTNIPTHQVHLTPHLIAYQANQGKDRLDGVAYYHINSDEPFWNAEISLPEAQRKLATPLLNQFIRKGN